MSHKNPPPFNKGDNYENWKKTLEIWQLVTPLEVNKQGAAIFLSLEKEAREAVLELPQEDIAGDEGVNNILNCLDNLYLKDKTQSAFEALEEFESLKRKDNQSIKDFCNQFDLAYNKTKNFGTTLSTDVLAFRLMKSANLKKDQEDLVKATIGDLNFENMKTHLKKIHVSVGAAVEDIKQEFFTDEHYFDGDDTEEISEDVYYTVKPRLNIPDEFGKPTKCGCCQSIYHYIKDCPHTSGQRGGYMGNPRGHSSYGNPRGRSGNQGQNRGRFAPRRPYNQF